MYLEQLSNAVGVSGDEGEIRKLLIEAAKPLAAEWRVDTMGNLFITRRARPHTERPLRVMVTAHMDEVGFMISKITDSGRLKFRPIGSFDRRILLGKPVSVGKERVPGVIGLKPSHLLQRGEYDRVGSVDSMYIDIGATGKNGTGSVAAGDFATFATTYGPLGGIDQGGNREGRVKGKAFDNRAGCAILLELLNEDYPVELVAVFTVQEEIGLRGARVAGYAANPDVAFVLECTAADDLPPIEPDEDDETDDKAPQGIPRLGQGPALTVMDRSFIADRRLVDLLIETAEINDIPYQFKRPGIGGTDAGAVHLAREGVPAAVVSVPARYIHAPASVLDLADFWRTIRLMRATLTNLTHWSHSS